ncbi:SO_0444 family Cu/Zn efflux transporter [Desulfosoma sp.]
MAETVWDTLQKIVESSWAILVESAPFVLFGLLAAGLVKVFLPEEKVLKHLGGRSTAAVVKASLLGMPLPLCSCGVVPVAVDLRKRGAGKGPSAAFLVSVPETGVDSIALSFALLGPVLAIVRPLAAFVTATVTGMLVSRLPESDSRDKALHPLPSRDGSTDLPVIPADTTVSIGRRLMRGMRYGFFDLLQDLGGWLFLGIFLSGVIAALLPQEVSRLLEAYEGESLLLMLMVGIPIYICASASTPIAAALLLKGLSPGAALVFLLAGPATNTATLAVIGRFWGKAVMVVYLLSVASCTLLMGFLTNRLFKTLEIPPPGSALAAADHAEGLVEPLSAVLLLALYLVPWGIGKIRPFGTGSARRQEPNPTCCSSLPAR